MNADDIDEITELITRLCENDFLLTFSEAYQTVLFDEWWSKVGKKAFLKWANKQTQNEQGRGFVAIAAVSMLFPMHCILIGVGCWALGFAFGKRC